MIFEEITGLDAERLADCIKLAAKMGWWVTKETQAGLNQNSGNVWLFDEEWPCCIYEGMNDEEPAFLWSCPNCGEEIGTDKIAEVEQAATYFETHEHCVECNKKGL